MNSNARRVAALGGSRIPFARQDGPYANASNQDMLTATLDHPVAKFGLFASQVLCTLNAWESADFCRQKLGLEDALGPIDRDKLNVRGGSLGAGHPFGATGGRIVANLAKMLADRGEGRGVISICAAGGLGVVATMEAAA
jgi:acetyl-CoA acetyltransferase